MYGGHRVLVPTPALIVLAVRGRSGEKAPKILASKLDSPDGSCDLGAWYFQHIPD